jgi:23S rRNA (cytidine1920-2'-O)/16S rRNA (cytidine1409-2'-O)-methyltransferase
MRHDQTISVLRDVLTDDGTEKGGRKRPEGKERLDVLVVVRGLATTRQRAQALILAGQVRVNGQAAGKAGMAVGTDARIEIAEGAAQKYVGRGGLKLEGALEDFAVAVTDKICLDTGSSTGGFTDCLLQHGARRVYAVDVNVAQMDWKLQQDERVEKIERNARYLKPEDVPEPIDLVTMDVSFISVSKVLPAVVVAARPGADFLILVKPQFELERGDISKGGIVRDAALHQRAIERVTAAAESCGLQSCGVRPSRITGAEGNVEFFLHATRRVE